MANGTDAFEQGKLAFANNHPMSSCDFPTGSSLRDDWMQGWTQARNAAPIASTGSATDPHPGMMGDGTEEQNLNQRGNPDARISESDVKQAFGNE